MATVNPFDLLGDDVDDPSQLIAVQEQKVLVQAKKTPAPAATQPAKLPSKPLPPAQAVRESKAGGERGGGGYGRGGGGGGGGYGRGGRGGSGFNNNRDSTNNSENAFGNRDFSSRSSRGSTIEEADSTKPRESRGVIPGGPPHRVGGRRSGFSNGEAASADGEPPRRVFERRSGTGRGNEMKREGSGRGNWGTPTDELSEVVDEVVNEGEKIPKKTDLVEADTTEGNKDIPATETEEKEPENKEMTLEEYEKVLEEKRKALQSLKTEERKVDDKEFASMQQLTSKKTSGDDIFIKLGSEKDKKKENAEKEEKAKKALSINEFLKPAEGERYYAPGGGRGRGRGRSGGRSGGYGGGGEGGGGENSTRNAQAPAIEDPGQFPSLSSK